MTYTQLSLFGDDLVVGPELDIVEELDLFAEIAEMVNREDSKAVLQILSPCLFEDARDEIIQLRELVEELKSGR